MGRALPETIPDVGALEELLSEPSETAVRALEQSPGDVLLLGAAGKMGPTLARMIVRASEALRAPRRVIGVSRFTTPGSEEKLQACGVETIRGDLLDETFLNDLPDAPIVVHLAVRKFGASTDAALTWAMNVLLPANVARRFPKSTIVAFSTGNVYPFVDANGPGSNERDPVSPIGEYATTALGRERMFEHFSRANGTPVSLIRLNYAVEMRYGVLVDIARKVWNDAPVDVTMGYANVIWQADANAMTLAALADAASPPFVVNVAGPERLRIRDVAEEFGRLLNKRVSIVGEEAPTALLSDGAEGHRRYGPPRVPAGTIVRWTADWIQRGGPLLDKPTHFQVRDGTF